MKHQVVCLRDGAIAEVERILDHSPQSRILFVVDEAAYAASGAKSILEPQFRLHSITRFSGFELNPKIEDVERGVELCRKSNPDIIIALGGGTAIDLSKSIRAVASQDATSHAVVTGEAPIRESGTPLIAIPTTAGTGSETTHFAVVYINNEKVSLADSSLLPDFAIVDPMLTGSLPTGITAATGLDAFCQAIESIWAIGATDQSLVFAQHAARLALAHLEDATCNPTGIARHGMAEAAHLAGKAINISKTTACHALSYPITSRYGIPHGMAVALSLSPVLAFNAQITASDCADPRGPEEVLDRIRLILELLESESVATACRRIESLISAVGAPMSLRQAGITTEVEIGWIVKQVNTHRLSNNPRIATPESLIELLRSSSQPHV